ncbi:MAG: starch-binding protein [Bacteroidota bacterium]
MVKRLAIFLLVLFPAFLASTAQNDTRVMIQGFNWESHSNSGPWYNVVKNNAADLGASGIDMIWMPPPSDAAAPQGYLPRELYDVSTPYGTQAQLQSCINDLHAQGIEVLADIVINHRVGSTNWADFQNPTWGCWAVTQNDEWGSNGGNPCGGYDTGDNYHAARDIDHTNATVRNSISAWMNWLKNTIGFDGWRYDYVRGYSGYYNGVYNDATGGSFSVGELWDNLDINNYNPHRQQIINWIDDSNGKSHAFDFTTKGILQVAVNGQLWRMSNNGSAPGVIGWYPSRAVTFLDNHDTGSTQGYWPFPGNRMMLGYAYILTHPGIPCVFWDHFYDWGLHDDIADIIAVRKNNGLHSTSTVDIKAASANLYAAEIDGKVAMKIGSGNWSPSGAGWTLRASGTDYAVWDKGSNSCQGGLTIHFKNTSNWSTPTIYFWGNTPAGASTNWPGEAMNNDGNGWYSYTIACANCSNLIFSNNGASQSANLNRCGEGWYDGSWHSSNPDNNAGGGDLIVHFRPITYSNPKIYFWNVTPSGATTSWPGVNMVSEGNGWYRYTFTGATCANFIFSNNGAGQSPDLNSCTEVWYENGSFKAHRDQQPVPSDPTLVTAYPQPAHAVLNLEIDPIIGAQRLELFDLIGRIVWNQDLEGDPTVRINVRNLDSGTYFYRIRGEAGIHSGKTTIHH